MFLQQFSFSQTSTRVCITRKKHGTRFLFLKYYSSKRQEASLIGYDKRALFPLGNMTLLINLKKAEHPKIYIAAREENNRLETVCLLHHTGLLQRKLTNGVVLGMCSMERL